MILRPLAPLAIAALLLTHATHALAGGDAVLGQKVFNKCATCHDAKREVNKVGPSLVGIVGRTAGTLESFKAKYSPAMIEAGAGGLVWNDENLADYMRRPKDKVPGNKMAFAGLTSDADIANVIAYLEANPKP